MKKYYYLCLALITILFVFSCSEDNDKEQKELEKNGMIEFSYRKAETKSDNDTKVVFTSRGNNDKELDFYGYFDPSHEWIQLIRSNPTDFQNRTGIFFSGTNLNTISYPFTFPHGVVNMENAQINYVIDEEVITDSSEQQISIFNTFAASTYSPNFEVTILSKENNVLRGTFEGELVNQDGEIINVKNGVFVIPIVEKQF